MQLGIFVFSILVDFGRQVGRPNRPKVRKKSIEKSIGVSCTYLGASWAILEASWRRLGAQKPMGLVNAARIQVAVTDLQGPLQEGFWKD